MKTISPQQLSLLTQQGTQPPLIDVRTPAEYQEVHIPWARNIPLDRLDPETLRREYAGVETLYVVCRSGSRGRQACEKLLAAGLNVVNVEGGTMAWEQAGLPVVRGRRVISLERQVRIAAGLLVLVGTSLGYFVHPGWLGLSAFVGAGLIYAGLTDRCGMALLLGRMPWNQATSAATKSSCSSAPVSPPKVSCCG
ncbi:MAG: sulfurtransferase [Planctomycetaceae bacterium]|nr:MAG: sulfurtransferase [Planctomycetaceae bacterium]